MHVMGIFSISQTILQMVTQASYRTKEKHRIYTNNKKEVQRKQD